MTLSAVLTGVALWTPTPLSAGLDSLSPREDLLTSRSARRMDPLSRKGAQTCLHAARMAGLDSLPSHRIALALGTIHGDLDGILRYLDRLETHGPRLANPAEFPNLMLGAPASHASLVGGWRGPQWVPCQPQGAGEEALAWALERLEDGDADAVVAAAGDLAGGARSPGQGLSAGEGMAAVVLEREEDARARGAPILAWLEEERSSGPLETDPLPQWTPYPSDGIHRIIAALTLPGPPVLRRGGRGIRFQILASEFFTSSLARSH